MRVDDDKITVMVTWVRIESVSGELIKLALPADFAGSGKQLEVFTLDGVKHVQIP